MAALKLTLGVCGGIAAYRAVELVRLLQDASFDPHVVMTASAEQFVTPLTFAAVSGHRVITSLWIGGEVPPNPTGELDWSSVEHIQEAQTSAALILVPATANILGKLAHGIADDFLTTLYTATRAPVVIAPAMNAAMWQHPAIQANVLRLRQCGNIIVEPATGYLACGTQGTGRLAGLPAIVEAVRQAVSPRTDLTGQTVLVTAGGTREPLDGVRFLGNRSSGRMGYALAEQAARRGAKVILISAARDLPIPNAVEFHPVSTAAEMHEAVLQHLPRVTLLLMAAAVADFRPATIAPGKLDRAAGLTLHLEPTEDIVAEAARLRPAGAIVAAFAAEMNASLDRARQKMLRKGVDAIVVNDVSRPGLGFDTPDNAGTLLIGDRTIDLPKSTKQEMAASLLDHLKPLLPNRGAP